MTYCVKYQAGTYSGVKMVHDCEDRQEAIDKVKAWVRKQMTIPMYSETYKIVDELEEALED